MGLHMQQSFGSVAPSLTPLGVVVAVVPTPCFVYNPFLSLPPLNSNIPPVPHAHQPQSPDLLPTVLQRENEQFQQQPEQVQSNINNQFLSPIAPNAHDHSIVSSVHTTFPFHNSDDQKRSENGHARKRAFSTSNLKHPSFVAKKAKHSGSNNKNKHHSERANIARGASAFPPQMIKGTDNKDNRCRVEREKASEENCTDGGPSGAISTLKNTSADLVRSMSISEEATMAKKETATQDKPQSTANEYDDDDDSSSKSDISTIKLLQPLRVPIVDADCAINTQNSMPSETNSDVTPKPVPDEMKSKTFPQKLMDVMIQTCKEEEAVAWLPDGKSFVIISPVLFVSKCLPLAFGGCKYSSFTRKLRRWGFVRMASGTGTDCFSHKLFQRDHPSLCDQMDCSKGKIETCLGTSRVKLLDDGAEGICLRSGADDSKNTMEEALKPPSLVGVDKYVKR